MEQVYAFCETVRGYMHKTRNIPCEDCSGAFSSEEALHTCSS